PDGTNSIPLESRGECAFVPAADTDSERRFSSVPMKSKVQSPTTFVKSTTEVEKSKVIEMRGVGRRSNVERRGVGRGVPTAQGDVRCTRTGGVGPPRPTLAKDGEEGVALVITLILLSVITFMAITFLVVSRGEKSTVGSVTEQTTARLAAEQALEMA